MAKDKNSFILFSDIIYPVEELTDEEAGKLFKHILRYVNDKDPECSDRVVNIAFQPIKTQLKAQLKRWNRTIEARSEAGKKSAEVRKQRKQKKEHISTKSTSVEKKEQTSTNSTVNDTVIVNVNDNVNNKENIMLSKLTFSDNVLNSSVYNRNAFLFWKLFKNNLLESGIRSTKNLDKAILSDWSKTIQLMIEKDGRTLDELKILYNFLKQNQFWKKNIQSVKKMREQFERLFMEANTKTNTIQNGKSTRTEQDKSDSEARTQRFVEKLQSDINNDKHV